MSKKWNSRAPSAFSSAFAVLILLSAGAAVAQQGGLRQLAVGAQDAIHGKDHSGLAKEQIAVSASAAPTTSGGPGGGGHESSATGTPAGACSATVAAVRATMPAADDTTGIAHALSVLEANCAKNPQAHGLINAIQNVGHGKGHTTNGHGAGKPPTKPTRPTKPTHPTNPTKPTKPPSPSPHPPHPTHGTGKPPTSPHPPHPTH